MDRNLTDKVKSKIILFGILSVLFAVVASLLGLIGYFFVSIAAAFLSVVFYLSHRAGKRVPYILGILFVVPDIVLMGAHSLNGTCAFIIAIILYRMIVARRNKSECVVYISLVAFIFMAASLFMYGAVNSGSANFNDVIAYYSEQRELFRDEFVNSFMDVYRSGSQSVSEKLDNISREDVEMLVDSAMSLLVGVLAVYAFAACGVCIKIFSRLASFNDDDRSFLKTWRFLPSALFSYTFIIVVLLNMFVLAEGTFGLSIANLYVLFTFVYAYLGYKILAEMIGAKFGSSLTGYILVTLGSVLLFSMAFQILSYFGAFSAISINKRISLKNNSGDNDKP